MKLGILLQTNNPEKAWNAFRLGIIALKDDNQAEVFLLGEGAEVETIPDSDSFNISEKISEFKHLGGVISACSTCFKMRGKHESKVCQISGIADLLRITKEADNIVSFG